MSWRAAIPRLLMAMTLGTPADAPDRMSTRVAVLLNVTVNCDECGHEDLHDEEDTTANEPAIRLAGPSHSDCVERAMCRPRAVWVPRCDLHGLLMIDPGTHDVTVSAYRWAGSIIPPD